MIDWFLRSRETGRITVAQPPNPPILVATAAILVRWLVSPEGTAGTVVDVTATGALVVWSVDEVARGVNPFRRLLGATVLVTVLRSRVA